MKENAEKTRKSIIRSESPGLDRKKLYRFTSDETWKILKWRQTAKLYRIRLANNGATRRLVRPDQIMQIREPIITDSGSTEEIEKLKAEIEKLKSHKKHCADTIDKQFDTMDKLRELAKELREDKEELIRENTRLTRRNEKLERNKTEEWKLIALNRNIHDVKEQVIQEKNSYCNWKEETKTEKRKHDNTKQELQKADEEIDDLELALQDKNEEIQYIEYDAHRRVMEERDIQRGVAKVAHEEMDMFETAEDARERNRKRHNEEDSKHSRHECRRVKRRSELYTKPQ